jgi:hypothetical protein
MFERPIRYNGNYVRIADAIYFNNNYDETSGEYLPLKIDIPDYLDKSRAAIRFTVVAADVELVPGSGNYDVVAFGGQYELRNLGFYVGYQLLLSQQYAIIECMLHSDENGVISINLYSTHRLYLQNIELFSDEFNQDNYWLNPNNPDNIIDVITPPPIVLPPLIPNPPLRDIPLSSNFRRLIENNK